MRSHPEAAQPSSGQNGMRFSSTNTFVKRREAPQVPQNQSTPVKRSSGNWTLAAARNGARNANASPKRTGSLIEAMLVQPS